MPLIENNKVEFSMDDFEKGLMLLGLISPKSIEEIQEKEELDDYERSLVKNKSTTYFKRAVLGAEIVTKLKNENTFGRIKFQKLVFLCEHISNMELSRYVKQAAGPFDNKFMHSIDKEFKKQKWFDVKTVKSGDYTVKRYVPMENVESYNKYYKNYFSAYDEHIQFIIELFRHRKTEETELAATVLACVLELKESDKIDRSNLMQVFYNWHDKKKRFTELQILTSFNWLKEKGLLPNDVNL
ncbi:type I restriction enzyme, S subunit/type I restriction enzyme M protein [Pedobacter sp. ok626]|uniref:hypothetical protein n=1 Tax=Pedobacter sp. ok626 TaxID=1761882 RepID=UPI000889F9E9|nr:hypothetical protein [Pedobacter sp. ok626]SDL67425.1 type I restriction enzyme, S subunit/type I restriction enzyme M protein [Pedobacter sp. ok626]